MESNNNNNKGGLSGTAKFCIVLAVICVVAFTTSFIGIAYHGWGWVQNKVYTMNNFFGNRVLESRFGENWYDETERASEELERKLDEMSDELDGVLEAAVGRGSLESAVGGFVGNVIGATSQIVSESLERAGEKIAESSLWNATDTTGLIDESLYEEFLAGEIKELDLEAVLGSITVVAAPTDKITVDYTALVSPSIAARHDPSVRVEGGELKFEQFSSTRLKPGFSGGLSNKIELVVTVPESRFNDIDVENVTGGITLKGINASKLDAAVVNGGIDADIDVGKASFESVNGYIRISTNTNNPDIDAQSVNGEIALYMNENPSIDYECSVINGSITIFGESKGKKSASGSMGSNRGNVDLSTVNGSISINQRAELAQ